MEFTLKILGAKHSDAKQARIIEYICRYSRWSNSNKKISNIDANRCCQTRPIISREHSHIAVENSMLCCVLSCLEHDTGLAWERTSELWYMCLPTCYCCTLMCASLVLLSRLISLPRSWHKYFVLVPKFFPLLNERWIDYLITRIQIVLHTCISCHFVTQLVQLVGSVKLCDLTTPVGSYYFVNVGVISKFGQKKKN